MSRIVLRRVAYLLVVLGFLWLALVDFETQMKGGIRPVIEAEYAKLDSSSRTYGKDEVRKFMREAVVAGYHTRPVVLVPGLMMFVGALVLARSKSTRNTR